MAQHRAEKPEKTKQPTRPKNRARRRKNWTKPRPYSGSLYGIV